MSFFLHIQRVAGAVTSRFLPIVCYYMHTFRSGRVRIAPPPHSYVAGLAVFCLVRFVGDFVGCLCGSAVIRDSLTASAVAPFLPRIFLFVQVVGRSVYSLRSGVLLTLVFQLLNIRFLGICNFFCSICFNFCTFVEIKL